LVGRIEALVGAVLVAESVYFILGMDAMAGGYPSARHRLISTLSAFFVLGAYWLTLGVLTLKGSKWGRRLNLWTMPVVFAAIDYHMTQFSEPSIRPSILASALAAVILCIAPAVMLSTPTAIEFFRKRSTRQQQDVAA
jgi:hypothetical protein